MKNLRHEALGIKRDSLYLLSLIMRTIWLVVLALSLSATGVSATPLKLPKNPYSNTNLFSLPLEEVLNIQVNQNVDELTRDAIYVLEAKRPSSIFKILQQTRITARGSSPEGNEQKTILLIDGNTVGEITTVQDLKRYIRYLWHSLSTVEIYTGQNALWLAGDASSGDIRLRVINLVTTSSSNKQEEVAKP